MGEGENWTHSEHQRWVDGGQVELDRGFVVFHKLPSGLLRDRLAGAIDFKSRRLRSFFFDDLLGSVIPVRLGERVGALFGFNYRRDRSCDDDSLDGRTRMG